MRDRQPQTDTRGVKGRCENCRFVRASALCWDQCQCSCQCLSPLLVPCQTRLTQQYSGGSDCVTMFPIVQCIDWCGAHVPGQLELVTSELLRQAQPSLVSMRRHDYPEHCRERLVSAIISDGPYEGLRGIPAAREDSAALVIRRATSEETT